MTDNELTRAQISAVLGEVAELQTAIGIPGLLESDELSEAWHIIERIQARMKATKDAAA